MSKQISLFDKKPETKSNAKKPSTYDKLCKKLTKNGLDTKLQLFPSKKTASILFWYATDSTVYGENKEKLCKLIKRIKPGRFYHMIINKKGTDLQCHIICYNEWLTGMVLKSEAKKDK